MKNITVYSGPMCNFCDAAKRLLSRNNLNYNEIDISTKEGLRDEMTKRANGRRTIPQIFFDDYHVCLLYTSPSPRDKRQSRMPSSA